MTEIFVREKEGDVLDVLAEKGQPKDLVPDHILTREGFPEAETRAWAVHAG